VKELAAEADIALIVGDPKSANSKRLQSISAQTVRDAYLITSPEMIEDRWFKGVETVLVTSGASTPEYMVQRIIERIRQIAPCEVVERVVVNENVHFGLPQNI
jgi:4-hydroxy-3-methylbut-2-enyl diphosphate reductase